MLAGRKSEREPAVKTALLRGRDVIPLGVIDAVAEGPAAIALSRGGAAKTYAYTEPNEDAAGFAIGPRGSLTVVADGHSGCDAAEVAVATLLARWSPRWTGHPDVAGTWESQAREALLDCQRAILAHVAQGGAPNARTTLVFAVTRECEDLLGYASMGDSHLFHIGGPEVIELAYDEMRRGLYLGAPQDTEETLPEKFVVGCEELAGTRFLALASDGLSERGIGVDVPEHTVAEVATRADGVAPDHRPLELARALTVCVDWCGT